jgi:hypothetical protein
MEHGHINSDVKHYRLDKTFGPAGASAGYFLLLVGIATIYLSFSGAILMVFGCFMAFSFTGCSVDSNNLRVRFTDVLFGFIRLGKWVTVTPGMQLGVSELRMVYRAHSMSNRSVEVAFDDCRVFLYSPGERRGRAICRFKKKEDALTEMARLSDMLGLEIRTQQPGKG